MEVVKLFPFRAANRLLFRGKSNGDGVSIFWPVRYGNQMILRGKNADGKIIFGYPYRHGNELRARTIAPGLGCCHVPGEDPAPGKTKAECDELEGVWLPECVTGEPADVTHCWCVHEEESGAWKFTETAWAYIEGFRAFLEGMGPLGGSSGCYQGDCETLFYPPDYPLMCDESEVALGDGRAVKWWTLHDNAAALNSFHYLDYTYVDEPGTWAPWSCFWQKDFTIDADETICRCYEPQQFSVRVKIYLAFDDYMKPGTDEIWQYLYIATFITITPVGASGYSGEPIYITNDYPSDYDEETGYYRGIGARVKISERRINWPSGVPLPNFTTCTKPPYTMHPTLVNIPPTDYCTPVEGGTGPYGQIFGFQGSVAEPTVTAYIYWLPV